MSGAALNTLLEKCANWDKDERYMATNDLCTELSKDVRIDAQLERRICAAVLKQLDDTSNDVQSIAVKCLGILVKKVQEAQVGEICSKLCSLILVDGKPELRDIYGMGLKTLIADVPESMGPSVAKNLTPRLLGGIQEEPGSDITLQCLDILNDLVRRFGREVQQDHESMMTAVMAQLASERPVVRKRATTCLGSMAVVISDPLLNQLSLQLLTQIEGGQKPEVVRTLIQTIGTISHTVGYRLGRHLNAIVPLFLKCCGDAGNEGLHTEASNELRENCFQGFQSFIKRCPREVTPHLDAIIAAALQYIKYDPNYSYNSDDDDGDDDAMNGDEEYSDDDFAGGSDDEDDTCWKVRRSAVRVLTEVVQCRPELLESLVNQCADTLISRFKEREENVRIEVISCFSHFLTAAVAAKARAGEDGQAGVAAVALLRSKLPAILKESQAQLKSAATSRSPKTAVCVWQMLRELCVALEGGLDGPPMATLVANALRCMKDKHQALKLEALLFLQLLLERHSPQSVWPFVSKLVPAITACVAEEWYKIIAEALRVVGSLVCCLCPDPKAPPSAQFVGYIQQLFAAVLPRLSAHDIDQEIKECAISGMGLLLARAGPCLKKELPKVLNLLMDRLRNEITRLSTLKALALLSSSPLNIDLSPILRDATQELALLLRQQSRPIKQAALEALLAILSSQNASRIEPALYTQILKEAPVLVSDADLHLAHLALQVFVVALAAAPKAALPSIKEELMPQALILATSPLLQGPALASLQDLLRGLVLVGAPGLAFEDLMGQMRSAALPEKGTPPPRQAVGNIAKCAAAVCASAGENERSKTVAGLVKDMKGTNEGSKHLALLIVGELGMQVDLSRAAELRKLLVGTFDTGSEESKTAAAYALGHLAVGSRSTYLPVVLQALEEGKHQYLLLSALKEVIVCHANASPPLDFSDSAKEVMQHLLKHSRDEEEGVRNMVAECLGVLATMHPDVVVDALLNLWRVASSNNNSDKDSLARWTVASSLKYCMAGRAPVAILAPHMPDFLTLLNDDSLDVKKAALLMTNAAAHHQPALIADLLEKTITPVLMTTVELRLVRTVDLGPFKHTIDDAEPLRKAALACIDTILDTLPDRLDEGALMPHLAVGLTDPKPDVQMLCHQILAKICDCSPSAILKNVAALIPPLDTTCKRKLTEAQSQVPTEVERANDLTRSALRCVAAISRVEDMEVSREFSEFRESLLRTERLRLMYTSITAERTLLDA